MNTEFLSQDKYESKSTGEPIPKEQIQVLGTYRYVVDGFFGWIYGKCGEKHGTRAVAKIHGSVVSCQKCHSSNLLVRTDCGVLDKGLKQFYELERQSHGWMTLYQGENDMKNPPVSVKILDSTGCIPKVAQRIANSLAEFKWEGDVEMVALIGSFLEQCGAKLQKEPKEYMAYFDGSSKGNPGPSRVGYIIVDKSGEVVDSNSVDIGHGTNNEAEYQALVTLLGKLRDLKVQNVLIRGDSKLVVNQLTKGWKVKAGNLKPFAKEARELLNNNPNWKLKWVPREENELADQLAQKGVE